MCEEDFRIAEAMEKEKDAETQDILHYIELKDLFPTTAFHIALKLRQVRKDRRKAKDTRALVNPVWEWAAANRKAVRELEKALSEVRRQEKHLKKRTYFPKTKVLDFLKER